MWTVLTIGGATATVHFVRLEVAMEEEMSACAPPVRRRFTVEEFQRMGESGVFAPDERVELIDGEIIEMTPVGPRHVGVVAHLTRFFHDLLGQDLLLSVQSPIQVGRSQPVPDVAVLGPREDRYLERLPVPADCRLLVEVGDTSAPVDRNVKRAAYAAAGIPEYWVVDLRTDSVVLHLAPTDGEYADVQEYGRDQVFASPTLGREVRVAEVLGGAPGVGLEG